jgi:RES domain-containing protein
MAETLWLYRRAGIPVEKAMPRLFVALRVSVSRALDLTIEGYLQRFGIDRNSLSADDWRSEQERGEAALTQTVGRVALATGIEAMLVPSLIVGGARIPFDGCGP